MNQLPRGVFIVFEGGDKSGKTTQRNKTAEYLQSCGFSVVTTREPGDGDPAIREALLSQKLSLEKQLELFCEDRRLHIKKIRMYLRERQVVLCDRFEQSTIAYQGGGYQFPVETILQKSKEARGETIPDHILLYDIDPRISFARSKAETSFEQESMEFQTRVRESYLQQAYKDIDRWSIIDASQSIGKAWEDTRKCVDAFFRRTFGMHL